MSNGVTVCNRQFKFQAVCGKDGDNSDYSRWTPSMEITMSVTNPACDFEPGREYYVDFVKAYDAREKPES